MFSTLVAIFDGENLHVTTKETKRDGEGEKSALKQCSDVT